MSPLISEILVFVMGAIIIIADIPLALDKTNGNTWSESIRRMSLRNFPSLPFSLMFLMGHFFGWKLWDYPVWLSFVVLLGNIGAIQFIRLVIRKPFNKQAILILAIVGFINGFVFWSM